MESFEDLYMEIQSGWVPIVRRLHKELLKIEPAHKVFQIKEKYGELCYYPNGPVSEIGQRLIGAATIECRKTCEFCGSTDEVETKGKSWVKTLCKVCHEKRST